MKKIFCITILVLLLSLLQFPTVNADNQFIKEQLSELTYQMIDEILLKNRDNMKYPLLLKNEIAKVLDIRFKNQEILEKKEIKQKIFIEIDNLYECNLEGWSGFVELEKTSTLYLLTLSLLSNYNGARHYMELISSLYNEIDNIDYEYFYRHVFDSYFTYKITSLYIECEYHNYEKTRCTNKIKHYLKELNRFIVEFEYNNPMFWKYKRKLEHIVKECTKEDYQIKSGDSYWSLARYIREKSDLPRENLKDETLLSKLARGVEKDLQNKGVNRLEVGEKIELYDAGYYISILIDEESLQ